MAPPPPVRFLTVLQPVATAMVTPSPESPWVSADPWTRCWCCGEKYGEGHAKGCATLDEEDVRGFVPVKPLENRSRPLWGAGHRARGIDAGVLVAIHAGLRWWTPQGISGPPVEHIPHPGMEWVRLRWPGLPEPAELPTGVVLGCVRVRKCIDVHGDAGDLSAMWERNSWAGRASSSPWLLGPWAWCIDRAWRLEVPIQRRGTITIGLADDEVRDACVRAGARLARSS